MAYQTIPPSALGGSIWYTTEAAAHAALIPQLTESVAIQCGIANVGEVMPAKLISAGVEGGAVRAASNTEWVRLVKPQVYLNAATSKIAVSFQGSLATLAASQASYFGIVSVETGAITTSINVGADIGVHATNFVAYAYNGATTTPVALGVADTAVHTWRIISNGTTVSIYRDGSVVGTIATNATNYPTGASGPGLFSTALSTGQALYKVLYSFVGP